MYEKDSRQLRIVKRIGEILWFVLTFSVLTLTAGFTLYVFAALVSPTALPTASDQDFTENVLGPNNAKNDCRGRQLVFRFFHCRILRVDV